MHIPDIGNYEDKKKMETMKIRRRWKMEDD